jgi:hypothetical protein
LHDLPVLGRASLAWRLLRLAPSGYFSRAFCYDIRQEARAMRPIYTAVIKPEAGGWIGWIEEVPAVNCPESSRGKLLSSLREALEMFLFGCWQS